MGSSRRPWDWEDAHLWEFTLGRERIGSSRAARLTLQDLLRPRTTRLDYTYDMGDCWEHQLTLTKPRPADPALAYPRYIAGENPARRKIAAASPASMRNSKPSPIRTTRITKTPRPGSAITIRTALTNSPSRTGSPASQTVAAQRRPKPNHGDQLTLTLYRCYNQSIRRNG